MDKKNIKSRFGKKYISSLILNFITIPFFFFFNYVHIINFGTYLGHSLFSTIFLIVAIIGVIFLILNWIFLYLGTSFYFVIFTQIMIILNVVVLSIGDIFFLSQEEVPILEVMGYLGIWILLFSIINIMLISSCKELFMIKKNAKKKWGVHKGEKPCPLFVGCPLCGESYSLFWVPKISGSYRIYCKNCNAEWIAENMIFHEADLTLVKTSDNSKGKQLLKQKKPLSSW